MVWLVFLAAAGLGSLALGADWLVRGSAGVGTRLGVSPLVIGLTVVAFGTSAPELAVSLRGVLGGATEVAVGNVVGSNTFNVLLVLGVSALVTPLRVDQKLVRFDVPLMAFVSGLVWWLSWDGSVGRVEGSALLAGLCVYTGWAVWASRREAEAVREEYAASVGGRAAGRLWVSVVLAAAGLGLCIAGATWLVEGAVGIARRVGVSELVIGVTVVAAGTSLPEASTSIVAAFRGERDIAVGNVVGSNLFNLMGILGVCGAVSGGLEVPRAALVVDFPVMFVAALVCVPVFATRHEVSRWEGGLLLALYLGSLVLMVMR